MKSMTKHLYIASWMPKGVEFGIGIYKLECTSGRISPVKKVECGQIVNMMTEDPDRQLIYAVDGAAALPGQPAGGGHIFVYDVNKETGDISKLQSVETLASNPFYIAIDREKTYALVAHHGGKSAITKVRKEADGVYARKIEYDDSVVELFTLNKDGTIGNLCDVSYHSGSGPTERQLSAHPHCVVFSPDGRFAACCDKGSDTVVIYRINRTTNTLEKVCRPFMCKPGYMPRYCVFHPDLPYLIIDGEGDTSLCVLHISSEGELNIVGYFDAAPEGYVRDDKVYEGQGLCIHPSGKYVYLACRGLDEIICFKLKEDGTLRVMQRYDTGESWPRGLGISSDGNWLVATMYQSGSIISLMIRDDGMLEAGDVFKTQEYASNVLICEA